MSATLVTPKTTSGGEIIRELINSSDGQGLHFDGTNGFIDIASPPDLGAAFSFEFIFKASTWTSGVIKILFDFEGSGDNRFMLRTNASGNNLRIYDGTTDVDTGVVIFDDLAVHHVVVTIDGTAAIVYDNGNKVATATISAAHGLDNATDARIGSDVAGRRPNGSFYRARFYNKALTQAEVDNAYQHADVDFADQYGSQTAKILNGTAWTGASGSTPPSSWIAGSGQVPNFTIDSSSGSGDEPALKFQRSANNMPYFFQTFTAIIGKKYRVAYRVKNIDAIHIRVGIGSSAVGTQYNVTDYTATDWASYEDTFTATTTTFSVYVQANTVTGTQGGYIDSVVVEQIGAVTDYDLAFANPTQSLMVQDRAGVADGTASATGVTQTQKIVQLNSKAISVSAATARTPADGAIIADKLGVGVAPTYVVDVSTSGNNGIRTNNGTAQLYMGSTAGVAAVGTLNDNTLNLIANGVAKMSIDSAGLVSVGNVTATKLLHLKSADPVIRLEDSDPDGVYSEIDGAGGDLIISCDGGNGAANSDIMFKVDGSTKMNIDSSGQVTVGVDADPSQTASPSMLITAATAPSDVNGYSQLVLQRSDGATGDGAQIMFNQGYHSGNTDYPAPVGAIRGYRTGPTDAYGGGVKLLYQPDNGNIGVKAGLTLDGAGDVSFYEDTGTSAKMRWDAADERLNLTGSDYQLSIKQGSNQAWFLRSKSDGSFAMHLNGANDKLSLSPAGLATFAGEITCTGLTISNQTNTTTGTRSSSKFDHYEEGTFTVTLGGASSVGNTTGYYTRIGDTVHVWYYSGSLTSDGSAASISGLPFTVKASSYGGFFTYHNTYCPTAITGYLSVNTTTGYFTAANATASANSANASGRYLMFTGTYKV